MTHLRGTCINDDDATRIVCDLVALPTVNPMGRPYSEFRACRDSG